MQSFCMHRDIILSIYRLGESDKEAFAGLYPDGRFVVLSDLVRADRLRQLFGLLLYRRKNLVLICDGRAPDLDAAINAVFGMGLAQQRISVDKNGVATRINRIDSLIGLAGILWESAKTRLSALTYASHCRSVGDRNDYKITLPQAAGLNILYLNPIMWRGPKVGGAVAHTVGVISGFQNLGHHIQAVSMIGQGLVAGPINIDPGPSMRFGFPVDMMPMRYHCLLLRHIKKNAPRQRPDLIYQRVVLGAFPGPMLAKKYKCPLVVEYNGSEIWVADNWGRPNRYRKIYLAAQKACLDSADLIVAISEALKQQLLSEGYDERKIIVCPNGVVPDDFSPEQFSQHKVQALRDKYGIPSTATVFTFVGSFGAWHGAEVLAQAFNRFLAECPEARGDAGAYLLLVGDGVRLADVEKILYERDARSNVVFAGVVPRDEVPLHLTASDVLVSPHVPMPNGEPFFGSPTKLFEYMAAEKLIIASDLDQIAEIFRGSPNIKDLIGKARSDKVDEVSAAILVEPGSVSDLVEALTLAFEHRGALAQFGKNARNRAIMEFTWDRHVEIILRELRSREWIAC